MYLKKQSDRISLDIKFDWHPWRLLLRSVYNFVKVCVVYSWRRPSYNPCQHVISN